MASNELPNIPIAVERNQQKSSVDRIQTKLENIECISHKYWKVWRDQKKKVTSSSSSATKFTISCSTTLDLDATHVGCVLLPLLDITPDVFFYVLLLGTTENIPRQLNSRWSSVAENKHQENLKKKGDEVVHMIDNGGSYLYPGRVSWIFCGRKFR